MERTVGGTLRHITGLDGIRGLAVVAVVLFHDAGLRGGFLGVDAFFVLSGFLITSLLLAGAADRGRVDLRTFWVRRARRLLPALLVVLGGIALFAAFVASPDELSRIRGDALATLGYVANWHSIAADHGYWSLFQAPSPLEHTWSLAIEEQFYLVWPLVVFAVVWFVARRPSRPNIGRHVARTITIASLVLAAVSTTLMWLLFDPTNTSRAYLGTDTRVSSILIGAALAGWLTWRGPVRSRGARRTLEVVAVLAAIGLGVAWATVDGQTSRLYQGGFLLCAIGVAVVIAAVAHPRPGALSGVLSWKPLCALGIISYGLYLWHWPVFVTVNETRTGLTGVALFAVRVSLSLAIAMASYFLVERPIRRGAFPARRLVFATPVIAGACVAAIIFTTAGASQTPDANAVVSAPSASLRMNAQTPVDTTGTSPRIMVAGDSVAINIGNAAMAIENDLRVNIRPAALAGCLLAPNMYERTIFRDGLTTFGVGNPCLPTWLAGQRAVAPSAVVVAYGFAGAFQDLSLAGQWSRPCDARYARWYEAKLRPVIKRFAQTGAQVWIVTLPHMIANWVPADANTRIDCMNAIHARIARQIKSVKLLDLAGFVCPRDQCRTTFDGQPGLPAVKKSLGL